MANLRRKPHASVPSQPRVGVMADNSDGTIWARLVQPERGDLSPDAARSILGLRFEKHDEARMHELALKAQTGTLAESEHAEIESYCRVGRLLDLLHSKARRSVKRSPANV